MSSIVNIGGISHSGSTLLGRIIANDDRAIYLGEIEALFAPTRKHHYEYIRRLSNNEMWSEILRCSVHDFYAKILDMCEIKDMLVDCSKSPLWISARNSDSRQMGLRYRNVLIFKTPYEMAESYNARNKDWVKAFENYCRRYFNCVDEFYVIAYRDLLESESSLERLCEYLGIQYFDNKKNYWEKEVEVIFGSEKANTRRSVSYEYTLTPDQESRVQKTLQESTVAERLWAVLEGNRDRICNTREKEFRELCLSKRELSLWAAANRAKKRYRRMFPEDYYKKRLVQ